VKCTPTRPTTTPTDVHTSVIRCLASASSAIERSVAALRSIATARPPLSAVDASDSAMPRPTACTGAGWNSLSPAAPTMAIAAATISTPSKPLEKYSALWWPYGCPSSGGCAAHDTIISANSAPTRLTSPSIASDNRLTEPLTYQAPAFNAIVATAITADTFR